MTKKRLLTAALGSAMLLSLITGCASNDLTTTSDTRAAEVAGDEVTDEGTSSEKETSETSEQASARDTMENHNDGEHVITADGEQAEYSGYDIEKTGDSEGDEADFYGENSALFATNGATLELSDLNIHTVGTHANAVFSYGEGTTVSISDSVIETEGNCSGGIMTTGGGTMNADNLTIHTTGRSSAAIRSDRGGGTVNVTGGSYTTDGTGSPAIYSTADITVSDAELTSTASEGVVVEGKNSVTLNNVTLTADNNQTNSDKSDTFKGVMIYQSMSGDAAEGKASFTMNDGSFTNENGDVFFVNNTVADITLKGVAITNQGDGLFLRAQAAGWGKEGSNGGHVNLYGEDQTINGDLVADDISTLNLYLSGNSSLTGSINETETKGNVYVELKDNSTWTLTGDSHIGSLTCVGGNIDLNGYKLYVDGKEYEEGSASSGKAYEIEQASVGAGKDGDRPAPPDGEGPEATPEGMEAPPKKPDGDQGGEPLAKPSGDKGGEPPAKPESAQ